MSTESKLHNRYQFHSVIGHGGTGEVSTAWDTQLERTVAIKRLRVADVEEKTMGATWQEAMRLAAIRHGNIVAVYDMGVEDGSPYIVMEYVQGETIEQRLNRAGPMPEEEFCEFARQTLEGVTAAHHAGLLHRDLKPANIMLARQPSGSALVKVLDFGISRFMDSSFAPDPEQTSVTGSIHFIAPEQLNREPVDGRTDLYSLGCVFYYALTGFYPFNGAKIADVMQAHLRHEVRPISMVLPGLSTELAQWVMALINRQPELRYANAQLALQSLNAIISVTRQTIAIPLPPRSSQMARISQVAHTSFPEPPQPAPRPGYWKVAAVSAAAAIAVAAGAVFIFGGGRNQAQPQAGVISQQPSVADAKPAPVQRPEFSTTQPVSIPVQQPAAAGTPGSQVAAALDSLPEAASVAKQDPVRPAPEMAKAPSQAAPALETTPTPAPAVSSVEPELVLRLHGSNTIGAKLAPMLVEEFLKRDGASSVERIPGKDHEEMTMVAKYANGIPKAVEICAHGSQTAFDGLASGAADIGMSSRQVKPEEAQTCERAGLGDLYSPLSEHVVGLDGLAVLVHKENPVKALTKQQVGDIFSGKITDWSAVGGTAGPIQLHARDAKSGTYDTFKSLVLGKAALVETAKRYEDSNALSDAVAGDPGSIGFVGLPYVRKARALAISDEGTQPFLATRFTVAAEDYVLSRRLFLYTPVAPQNPLVAKFVEFALHPEGQEIVSKAGFVKQTIDLERPIVPAGAPAEYQDRVRDAERLSVNLRFRAGKTELDNKALRDLDRICAMLNDPANTRRGLMLFGFADNQGAAAANVKMSRERAEHVAKQLEGRGVKASVITGYGPALPVATNADEAGRQRNRRVELWLRTTSASTADSKPGNF